MDLGLAGAAVVVQGGTKGMGRAAAECYATDGARVGVLARTQADLEETTKHLESLRARAHPGRKNQPPSGRRPPPPRSRCEPTSPSPTKSPPRSPRSARRGVNST